VLNVNVSVVAFVGDADGLAVSAGVPNDPAKAAHVPTPSTPSKATPTTRLALLAVLNETLPRIKKSCPSPLL
jgi:hypothetical protein